MSFTSLDIKNSCKYTGAKLVSLTFPFHFRYYFSSSLTGIFLNGGLKLTGGTEEIKGGGQTNTHFFFGPTIEEGIGFQISDIISVHGGLFQLLYIGSDVLPSDIGFTVSLIISDGF